MNSNLWKTIGITVLVFNILFMFGIVGAIFNNLNFSSNLFNTGLTPGIILGAANVVVLYGVYKGNL